jgi:hypothetical protein
MGYAAWRIINPYIRKYLHESDTKFENILGHDHGPRGCWLMEKNRGKKSRDAVPLKLMLLRTRWFTDSNSIRMLSIYLTACIKLINGLLVRWRIWYCDAAPANQKNHAISSYFVFRFYFIFRSTKTQRENKVLQLADEISVVAWV